MAGITIRLFGRFVAMCDERPICGLSASKVQELLCYLLLQRDRPQSREVLIGVLWGDCDSVRAKKYLRQTLWQLQAALRPFDTEAHRFLHIEGEWIELRSVPQLWLDVAVFEAAAARTVSAQADPTADRESAQRARDAIAVYQEDLLPGWYHDWCSYQRERLQGMYLGLLDRLMEHCESSGRAEEGLRYAILSLRHDRARERTHQHMMRLYALAGDRAAALRQFDRCVIAMDEELGVTPAAETQALYETLRRGGIETRTAARVDIAGTDLSELLASLRQIRCNLDQYQQQVQAGIDALEHVMLTRSEAQPKNGRRVIQMARGAT